MLEVESNDGAVAVRASDLAPAIDNDGTLT
jgi:hypothetical protein